MEKGKLAAAERTQMLARIEPCDLYGKELEAVDFVVEAATEDVDVKREIFATLDRACRGDVVLATNTSSISITAIGAAVTRPERVIGMHFMNPPPLMKLVEIIRGLATGDATYEVTRALAERLGKQTVRLARHPGLHRQPHADADAERGLLRALRGDRLGRGHGHRHPARASTTRWGRSR